MSFEDDENYSYNTPSQPYLHFCNNSALSAADFGLRFSAKCLSSGACMPTS